LNQMTTTTIHKQCEENQSQYQLLQQRNRKHRKKSIDG
jgi:hypothetical protein